jgi:hypothetical protein
MGFDTGGGQGRAVELLMAEDIAERERHTDSEILHLLSEPDSRWPWSVAEVERVFGNEAHDSLNRLHGGGLIHRHGGFVWPTRAALKAQDIEV